MGVCFKVFIDDVFIIVLGVIVVVLILVLLCKNDSCFVDFS